MQIKEKNEKSQGPNFDIINPSFTINNKQKISIKAEKGNFITDQKILLEKKYGQKKVCHLKRLMKL